MNARTRTVLFGAALALLCGCAPEPPEQPDEDAGDTAAPPAAVAEEAAPTPLQAGQAFLVENAKREGVVTTASGLQYEVLVAGAGASPGPADTVTAHYHGTLLDGRVFDSSVQRDQPLEIPVDRVIKGWTEALQLMRVGDKWKLFIPSDLAYGKSGAGSMIGPDETLIFEVELLAVEPV